MSTFREESKRVAKLSRQLAMTCRCGVEPVFATDGVLDFVRCESCGAEGPPAFDHYEAAILGWNQGRREKEGKYPAGCDYQI